MNDIWQDLLHARAEATLPIGFVLAVGVTVHILLNKRQVASAVGWIGLVWFAPIGGAICYLLLGVNRVKRRAHLLRARGDGADDRLAAPCLRAASRPIHLAAPRIVGRADRAGR